MSEKWEYGGSYLNYPIKPAVPYIIDKNIIMASDPVSYTHLTLPTT